MSKPVAECNVCGVWSPSNEMHRVRTPHGSRIYLCGYHYKLYDKKTGKVHETSE